MQYLRDSTPGTSKEETVTSPNRKDDILMLSPFLQSVTFLFQKEKNHLKSDCFGYPGVCSYQTGPMMPLRVLRLFLSLDEEVELLIRDTWYSGQFTIPVSLQELLPSRTIARSVRGRSSDGRLMYLHLSVLALFFAAPS